ncbi:AAA family ATPase [Nocardioides limicola]|uniref:AAA family ATPase n=1 Tax=Nocardioides limicola TaxID=2803368 RepID=UPI00193B3D6B|nr:ATP-binding protein [Nocardioides sp. DJM-14]
MHDTQAAWLHGFAIKGPGGLLGETPVRVGPLAKVNFLVGRNNHGKSTLLKAATRWVPGSTRTKGLVAETLVPVKREAMKRFFRTEQGLQAAIVEGQALELDSTRVAVWVKAEPGTELKSGYVMQELTRPAGGTSINDAAIGLHLARKAVLIPAFRALSPIDDETGKTAPALYKGEGLVRELATWQNPVNPGTAGYDAARARWGSLREFMRDVLEDPNADLEVAANQTDLHVRLAQAGRMLKIDDLGDGVKQVLMIAAACVYYSDHLVCLEEPEIHLHAGLQRKLMKFLAEKTSNQYLIATHSAHVLDLPGARIFHVTHNGESTQVAPAVRASEVQRICQDLGYMASDLLQANYTVWVEGPSDRIYWRRWLELVDPDLAEGVHYTVMSYGGYLVSEVSLEPDEAANTFEDGLVRLLNLGRECTLIADSDKASATSELSPTILRLREEARSDGSGRLVVIEEVRTVENLIPRELFREVVTERHPNAGRRLKKADGYGRFEKPFEGMRAGTYSKPEIARLVADRLQPEHVDGVLRTEVGALASRIRAANGLGERDTAVGGV